MKVSELIDRLKLMPQDATVWHLWDGCLRTEINLVWRTNNGRVGTSDYGEICYYNEDRPDYAPSEQENKHWYTESDPNPIEEDDF